MIGCIIQARVNSQRLPKKILKDLDEKNNALEYVLNQLKHSKKIDQIVIAATDLNDDNIIANFAEKNKPYDKAGQSTLFLGQGEKRPKYGLTLIRCKKSTSG